MKLHAYTYHVLIHISILSCAAGEERQQAKAMSRKEDNIGLSYPQTKGYIGSQPEKQSGKTGSNEFKEGIAT
jgi:hypothetical protein